MGLNSQLVEQAMVVSQDTLSFNKASKRLALFNTDGTQLTPVTVNTAKPAVSEALRWKIPENYGIDLTGATVHTAAQVQPWLDSGYVYASGIISCSETLIIKDSADLSRLTLNYTGSGVAVKVGDPASQLFTKIILCPRVVAVSKTVIGWAQVAGSVGIQISNAYSCSITIPYVKNFETGVLVTGVPIEAAIQGTQQCGLYPLHLDNNKVNLAVRPYVGTSQSDSGWANENRVMGGRFTHNSNEGSVVSGVTHVQIATCPNVVNGWLFDGTSLESPNVVDFHIDTYSQYCTFINSRFENTGGDVNRKVRSRGTARGNTLIRGFNAGQITQVLTDTAYPFDTDTDVQFSRRGGDATTPVMVLENKNSSTAPVLSIMEAGAGSAGSSPATAWCVKSTAQQWAGKRGVDTNARVIMDYVNGRIYVGDATAPPVAYIGGSASTMYVAGSVPFIPLADATQDLGISSLKWRDIRLSRGIGVHGTTPPTTKPAVTGSRGGNAALASLLTALASYGLITDSSTA